METEKPKDLNLRPDAEDRTARQKLIWNVIFVLFEVLIIIFLGVFFDFGKLLQPKHALSQGDESTKELSSSYPLFQDVHVMAFVGFGFLYTYLKAHSWSSFALNFFLGAFTIEFSLLTLAFWECVFVGHWEVIELNLSWMINADFAAATVMVSFGAVAGKLSVPQYLMLTICETIICSLNYRLDELTLHAIDAGGSMYIHSFGAFFGASAAWVLHYHEGEQCKDKNNSSSYTSNTFAFIGTIFLWMFWPSFNTALIGGSSRYRGIFNTYLSMIGSCVGTFIMSSFARRGKFEIEDILNASVSGGVIIGGSCNVIIYPWASLLIGFFGGTISTICFEYVTPIFRNKMNLFDTAGILNLHGFPGVFGGIFTAIFASSVNYEDWGSGHLLDFSKMDKRSPSEQAGFQIAALFITLGTSIVGGGLTGLLLKLPCFLPVDNYFHDKVYFHNEDGEEEEEDIEKKNIRKETEMVPLSSQSPIPGTKTPQH